MDFSLIFKEKGKINMEIRATKMIMKQWRGCEDVFMVSHGEWADPDLVWKDYTFNYWDIENALWDMYLEDNGITERDTYTEGTSNIDEYYENGFSIYCQEHVASYMEDVIDGGYFNGCPNNNWHDLYKKEV